MHDFTHNRNNYGWFCNSKNINKTDKFLHPLLHSSSPVLSQRLVIMLHDKYDQRCHYNPA